MSSLCPDDPSTFNSAFIERHANSPPHILAAAQGRAEIDPTPPKPIADILARLYASDVPADLECMTEGLTLLQRIGGDLPAFKTGCKARLPLATVFDEPKLKPSINGHDRSSSDA